VSQEGKVSLFSRSNDIAAADLRVAREPLQEIRRIISQIIATDQRNARFFEGNT